MERPLDDVMADLRADARACRLRGESAELLDEALDWLFGLALARENARRLPVDGLLREGELLELVEVA